MNWKPAMICIFLALLLLFAGFRLGVNTFKAHARAYIIFDTIYIDSFAGEALTLVADETLRPRR